MSPQKSFIHYLVIPFLLVVFAASGYFIYKTNPQIMDQESFYQKLSHSSDSSEVHILSEEQSAELFKPATKTVLPRQTHRYVETGEEKFKPIPLNNESISWTIAKNLILTKVKSRLSVSTLHGEKKWSFEAPKGQQFVEGPISNVGGVWFASTAQGRLYALNTESGELIWYIEKDHNYFRESLVANDDLLTFFEDKSGQTWNLEIIDPLTGRFKKLYKKFELPLAGDPIVKDNILYFATQNGQLRAIDLTTGTSTWISEGSSSFRSGPQIIGEKIYLTNEDGLLLAFDKKNGRKSHEIEMGSVIHEPVKLVEGTNIVITLDINGGLIAADIKTNKRLWHYNLNMSSTQDQNIKLIRLSHQSMAQLNFNSEVMGWTAWVSCSSTRICIFDVKAGRLLHRMELKESPLAHFEIAGESDPLLYVPVGDKGSTKIIALEGLTKSSSTPSPLVK